MLNRLIILTGPTELPFFADYAHRVVAGRCAVHLATTPQALAAALGPDGSGARILACCSQIIVSPEQLDSLTLTPYNIHPGSPEYPGVLPEYWAHADGAAHFGATLHHMTKDIDAGPIIDARLMPITQPITAESLGSIAHGQAIALFRDTLPRLVESDQDLPPKSGLTWTGQYRSKADFRARFGDLPGSDELPGIALPLTG